MAIKIVSTVINGQIAEALGAAAAFGAGTPGAGIGGYFTAGG